jgi:hypothetical protein
MQLAHGYTEETEDGMTWRIDRLPNNDDSIVNIHIYENIINEQTVGSLAPIWRADRDRSQDYWPFNRQPVIPRQINGTCFLLCTETAKELDAIEECGICYEPVKLHDTVSLDCCHTFCVKCIDTYLSTIEIYKAPCCAFCRAPIESLLVKNLDAQEILEKHCVN